MKNTITSLLIVTMSLFPLSLAAPKGTSEDMSKDTSKDTSKGKTDDKPGDEFDKVGYLAYSCAEVSDTYDDFRKCITIEIKSILEGLEIKAGEEEKEEKEKEKKKEEKEKE
ncbi:hypothetical protein BDV29DRAFT_179027 [Aspergillus leporis]|uniref:Uncharacterized protein n=1 Tax=Aspergillus leporis TaxID=41062 RepID=A0A5N5WTC9_9EURO|nr:hypothetical protein BDV29DRAFT_179027 [Aspergillus leporis]